MKVIIKRYVIGYFWLDFLSTFPFDLILSEFNLESNGGEKLVRLSRLTDFSRLAKVFRLFKITKVAKYGKKLN